jgi:hypothetical protein
LILPGTFRFCSAETCSSERDLADPLRLLFDVASRLPRGSPSHSMPPAASIHCGTGYASWHSKRGMRPFRIACVDIASIVGCGGSQHPILATDRKSRSTIGGSVWRSSSKPTRGSRECSPPHPNRSIAGVPRATPRWEVSARLKSPRSHDANDWACDKREWSAPITTMRAILKRYLLVRIDPRARSVGSTSFVEGNQTSCSLGIKLLLVRSPPQGIEQTSTRSRTNDPVVKRAWRMIHEYQSQVDNTGPCIQPTR